MIQKDKVAAMTHLAIEEKNQQHLSFITRHYWFNDYITTEMWKAFFAITLTFALVFFFGLVAYGDSWTVTYHIADVINLAYRTLKIYAAVLIIGILLCALSHVWMYRQAYRKQERIRGELRKISRLYALEDAIHNLQKKESGSEK
ncbi:MAG: hypothetical protein J5496_01270 [Lachnospiraceae bacterium]|nr:hypothetical protein [Lachnospiraceae bacterium]